MLLGGGAAEVLAPVQPVRQAVFPHQHFLFFASQAGHARSSAIADSSLALLGTAAGTACCLLRVSAMLSTQHYDHRTKFCLASWLGKA